MKIFLVDDHEMMALGMKTWIETNTDYSVTGTARNIEDAISFLKKNSEEQIPDVLIVDVDLGRENGFDLVRSVKTENPDIKILMYSMHKEAGYVLDAKMCGADGYISKDSNIEDFKACLETIVSGKVSFNTLPSAKSAKLEEDLKFLTPKEQKVLFEILKKAPNEEIALNLNISVHSVEIYVSRIYSKLDVHFREDLIKMFD